MRHDKLISTLETLGITLLGTALSYLAAHAAEINPGWGPSIGTISLGLLNLLNGWLAKPAPNGTQVTPGEQIVSLAIRNKEEV